MQLLIAEYYYYKNTVTFLKFQEIDFGKRQDYIE